MNKYYRIMFNRGANNYLIYIYDESFTKQDIIKAKRNSDGKYIYNETKLPIDLSELIQVVEVGDIMSSIYDTEPINEKWSRVIRMPDYSDKQLENIAKNINKS